MSRPRTTGKSHTREQRALIELRKHLGMTQQQLAVHMNLAITTIARWESSRPPSGQSLTALIELAKESNRPDLGEVFEDELMAEANRFLFESEQPATDPAKPLQDAVAQALLYGVNREAPNSRLGRAYRRAAKAIMALHAEVIQAEAAGRVKTDALGPRPRLELARTRFFLDRIQKEWRLSQQRKGLR